MARGGEGQVTTQSRSEGSDTDSIVSDRPGMVAGEQADTVAVPVGIDEENEAN